MCVEKSVCCWGQLVYCRSFAKSTNQIEQDTNGSLVHYTQSITVYLEEQFSQDLCSLQYVIKKCVYHLLFIQ